MSIDDYGLSDFFPASSDYIEEPGIVAYQVYDELTVNPDNVDNEGLGAPVLDMIALIREDSSGMSRGAVLIHQGVLYDGFDGSVKDYGDCDVSDDFKMIVSLTPSEMSAFSKDMIATLDLSGLDGVEACRDVIDDVAGKVPMSILDTDNNRAESYGGGRIVVVDRGMHVSPSMMMSEWSRLEEENFAVRKGKEPSFGEGIADDFGIYHHPDTFDGYGLPVLDGKYAEAYEAIDKGKGALSLDWVSAEARFFDMPNGEPAIFLGYGGAAASLDSCDNIVIARDEEGIGELYRKEGIAPDVESLVNDVKNEYIEILAKGRGSDLRRVVIDAVDACDAIDAPKPKDTTPVPESAKNIESICDEYDLPE